MGVSRGEEPTAIITPYIDGPLLIRGDFRIQEWDGTPIPASRQVVALCRCGRSAIQPFCDGSHAAGPRAVRRRQNGQHADSAKEAKDARADSEQAGPPDCAVPGLTDIRR
jgi:CDGSH-type Zn-finger protein